MELRADIKMAELQKKILGARRTLFRHYHIGGCSSCGFQPEETLEQVCFRNEQLDVQDVIQTLLNGYEEEKKLFITPLTLQQLLADNSVISLVDVRSRDEHQAVSIKGSIHFDQNLMQEWMKNREKAGLIVFYDHKGSNVLEAASYFIGHGFLQVKCLQGGIDSWAVEIDPAMPRYVVE